MYTATVLVLEECNNASHMIVCSCATHSIFLPISAMMTTMHWYIVKTKSHDTIIYWKAGQFTPSWWSSHMTVRIVLGKGGGVAICTTSGVQILSGIWTNLHSYGKDLGRRPIQKFSIGSSWIRMVELWSLSKFKFEFWSNATSNLGISPISV
jgi:hypothetical protein